MIQELDDDCKSRIFNKYCWTWSEIWMRTAAICLRTSATQFSATTSISTLEPITGRKSETEIPRNIDGSRTGKTIRTSRYVVMSLVWTRHWTGIVFPRRYEVYTTVVVKSLRFSLLLRKSKQILLWWAEALAATLRESEWRQIMRVRTSKWGKSLLAWY